MFEFEILAKDTKSRARVGSLKTKHGVIKTPTYVIVGTDAEVRCLTPGDMLQNITNTQVIIANTYHLWRRLNGSLDQFEGLHKAMNWDGPIMTDSGGFQVFSFGFGREHGVGKIASMFPAEAVKIGHFNNNGQTEKNLVRITDDGVYFNDEGEEFFLDAKISIGIQKNLKADIILAFDECTSPFHDYEYTRQALERTHQWALESLKIHSEQPKQQLLFGIVQGGAFEDLRKESAQFIAGLPFDGFGIGGSFGKSEMIGVLEWVIPLLPGNKPRHLLGVGRIEDIFRAVEKGIDMFDCVIPTREARHGALWTSNGRFDIKKGIYKNDRKSIQNACSCPICSNWHITRSELHSLFKAKALDAARFATIHNVFFFNDLMEKIREAIRRGKFIKFKEKYLQNFTK